MTHSYSTIAVRNSAADHHQPGAVQQEAADRPPVVGFGGIGASISCPGQVVVGAGFFPKLLRHHSRDLLHLLQVLPAVPQGRAGSCKFSCSGFWHKTTVWVLSMLSDPVQWFSSGYSGVFHCFFRETGSTVVGPNAGCRIVLLRKL